MEKDIEMLAAEAYEALVWKIQEVYPALPVEKIHEVINTVVESEYLEKLAEMPRAKVLQEED